MQLIEALTPQFDFAKASPAADSLAAVLRLVAPGPKDEKGQ